MWKKEKIESLLSKVSTLALNCVILKVSELQSSLEVSRSAITTSSEQFTATKVEIDHLKISMNKLQKEVCFILI